MDIYWMRLSVALKTWPDGRGWRDALLLLLIWLVIALLVGSVTRFFRWEWSDSSARKLASFAAIAVAVPCLAEELCFRVLLLPLPSEVPSNAAWWGYAGVALALFVLWHPLNGRLLKVSARSIFFDPAFLLLAAVMGLICTLAYRQTGSVWPAVAIHWLTLMVWKVGLGGRVIAIGT
ncbi:MAG: Abortive infection protein [Phycisphaerales bacterium]|nr:Abortive infection protein [Phycisphaerales bacterium]